jgi:hypothetical protein
VHSPDTACLQDEHDILPLSSEYGDRDMVAFVKFGFDKEVGSMI